MRGLIKFIGTFGTLAIFGYVILNLIISGIVAFGTFLGILFVAVLLPSVTISSLAHLLSSKGRRPLKVRTNLSKSGNLCPYCRNKVGEREIICTNCFEDLIANCPHCGQLVRTQAKECPQCGISLKSKIAT